MILLLPKFLTIKKYFRPTKGKKRPASLWIRDGILLLLGISLILLLGQGTIETLSKISSGLSIAYIPPSVPIGLTLTLLHVMLLFSCVVNSIGALFMAHDLDLVHASPISSTTFFTSKLSEICLSSSWMACIFGMPVLVAVGIFYGGGLEYYGACLIGGLLYLLIPAALAIIIVTLLAYTIPIRRTKEILIACTGIALFSLFYSMKLILRISEESVGANGILKLISYLHITDTAYSPASWLSRLLSEILLNNTTRTSSYLWAALIFTTCGLLCIAAGTIHLLYKKALSRSLSTHVKTFFTSPRLFSVLELLFSRPVAGILKKEYLLFTRDMSQAAQLLLLLGLTSIYLYNFKMLGSAKNISADGAYWWQGILTITNLAMGAFVITAICSRFVFTSISLEGQGYWSLKKSPLSIKDILKAKRLAWMFPVLVVGGVLFFSASCALNATLDILAMVITIGSLTSIGLLGLAIGLGAYFANFSWEHPAQLAASFGSLVFMLCATALIACNCIPIILFVYVKFQHPELLTISACICTLMSLSLNLYIHSRALSIGSNELERRARDDS